MVCGVSAPSAPVVPQQPTEPMPTTGSDTASPKGCGYAAAPTDVETGTNTGAVPAEGGVATAEEMDANAFFEELFNGIDADKDGSINMQELKDFLMDRIMENGSRDMESSTGQQEAVDGKEPAAVAADEAANQTSHDSGHGAHGSADKSGEEKKGQGTTNGMTGGQTVAGPAAAPVASCA